MKFLVPVLLIELLLIAIFSYLRYRQRSGDLIQKKEELAMIRQFNIANLKNADFSKLLESNRGISLLYTLSTYPNETISKKAIDALGQVKTKSNAEAEIENEINEMGTPLPKVTMDMIITAIARKIKTKSLYSISDFNIEAEDLVRHKSNITAKVLKNLEVAINNVNSTKDPKNKATRALYELDKLKPIMNTLQEISEIESQMVLKEEPARGEGASGDSILRRNSEKKSF